MKNKLLYFYKILLLIFIIIFITGCAKDKSEAFPSINLFPAIINNVSEENEIVSPIPNPNNEIVLTLGYFGDPEELQAYEFAISGISEHIPEIKEVKLKPYSGSKAFFERLPIEVANGTAPDIINFSNEQHLQLIREGLILPIDNYDIDFSSLSGPALNVWKYENKIYALPISAAPACFIINNDLWDAAGLGKYPETWEEVYEAAKVLTKDGIKGLCIDTGFTFTITQYIKSFGGGWNNGSSIDSKENIDALEFIFKMFKEDLATTPKESNCTWDGEVFVSGKCVMTTGGTWYSGLMNTRAPNIDYSFVPMPGGNGNNGCTMHSRAYAIVKGTPNPALVSKVLEYLARSEYQETGAQYSGLRPTNKKLLHKFIEINPKLEVLSTYEHTATSYDYPDDPNFQTDLISAVERVIYGADTSSAKEILSRLAATYGD